MRKQHGPKGPGATLLEARDGWFFLFAFNFSGKKKSFGKMCGVVLRLL